MKEATFGAGCFWCVEACFKELKGVISVHSGYSGGNIINPTYRQVCEGTTNHAEIIRIVFDENSISFEELLEVFWFVHDPTQFNRQGADIDESQKNIAEFYKQKLAKEKVWEKEIVTEISPLINYFSAEEYHNNYFELNPENSYCQSIVRPKVEKFKKVFEGKLSSK